jgi:iron complex transport system substrate-binding protein
MRICSFLPSATEIVYELGLEDQLYGVTHECDFPPDAARKPHVVHSVFDGMEPTSAEINRVISERLQQGLGIYDIDQEIMKAAEPDLLLTQAICEV